MPARGASTRGTNLRLTTSSRLEASASTPAWTWVSSHISHRRQRGHAGGPASAPARPTAKRSRERGRRPPQTDGARLPYEATAAGARHLRHRAHHALSLPQLRGFECHQVECRQGIRGVGLHGWLEDARGGFNATPAHLDRDPRPSVHPSPKLLRSPRAPAGSTSSNGSQQRRRWPAATPWSGVARQAMSRLALAQPSNRFPGWRPCQRCFGSDWRREHTSGMAAT